MGRAGRWATRRTNEEKGAGTPSGARAAAGRGRRRGRAADGGDDERDRDERPDPHHLRHVERGGGEEAEGADEPALAYRLCLCAYPPHGTFRALAIHTAARFPGNPP